MSTLEKSKRETEPQQESDTKLLKGRFLTSYKPLHLLFTQKCNELSELSLLLMLNVAILCCFCSHNKKFQAVQQWTIDLFSWNILQKWIGCDTSTYVTHYWHFHSSNWWLCSYSIFWPFFVSVCQFYLWEKKLIQRQSKKDKFWNTFVITVMTSY